MNDKQYIEKIAALVGRHPSLCYDIQPEDSHCPYLPAEIDMSNNTLCQVWGQYSQALFESIRLMVRYERSLAAWNQLADEADDEVKDTLVMDYAYPTLRLACDLPNAFKDQLVRAVVKLEHIAVGDYSYIEAGVVSGAKRVDWFKVFKRGEHEGLAKEIRDVVDGDLFASDDAKHFRDLHGNSMHDSSVNLAEGQLAPTEVCSGVVMLCFEEPLNIGKELVVLCRHRKKLQHAYELFDAYARELYKGAASAGGKLGDADS